MKMYKKVMKEVEAVDSLTCDICGKKGNPHFGFGDGWDETVDSRVECTIYADDHRGGGWNDHIEFDICPGCFGEYLVPFLNSLCPKGQDKKQWTREEY